MSARVEAAARAMVDMSVKRQTTDAGELAATALAAADADDAASGVHRVSLDDDTVERAARAAYDAQMEDGDTPWDHFGGSSYLDYWRDQARAVLAAAVKEGQ